MRSRKFVNVFFLILVFLFLGEFSVRIFAPQELISDVIVFDEAPCHRLRKSAQGVQSSADYRIKIETNSYGLRDYEISNEKNADTFRILVLGDAHTFGWGVDMDSTFVKVLERNLNLRQDGSEYQVINAGVMGYSLGHEYQFLTSTGYAIKPDLVIIAMDLCHDLIVDTRYFYVQNNQLIRNEVLCTFLRTRSVCKYIPFCSYLRGNSQLFRFTGVSLMSIYDQLRSTSDSDASVDEREFYEHMTTQKILKLINDDLRSRNIQFVVIIVPEMRISIDENLNTMRGFLVEEGIAHVALQNDYDAHKHKATLTFKKSLHFNSRAHRFIADLMTDFILKNSWLDKGDE